MTLYTAGDSLNFSNASQAWDLLTARVEAFAAAWKDAAEPPSIAGFLPEQPPALRRLALIELIKLDLEYRWPNEAWRKALESYLDEFRELSAGGNVPCELVYEEYHVRKQAGEDVAPQDYFERFPQQAAELGRLLGIESPHMSTALVAAEKPESFEAGQKIDDFDLLARLGQGAFATVFLARQQSMQRLVALKISSDRGNEPQTMAQMDHPHIVRVFDQRLLHGRKLRLLYMQYVPGGTLQAVVEQVKRTPPGARSGRLLLTVIDRSLENRGESPPTESSTRQALAAANWWQTVCWVGSRLAAALEYAHRRGVLHRDLKPANVLLAADAGPKLVDFNISFCSKVEGATAAAYFGGSLAYMSPEQLEAFNPANERSADELGAASDVYALGIVLWELLVGHRPFRDEEMTGDWTEILATMATRRRQGVTAETRAALPADCPPELAQVLLTCLDPDLKKRYSTAAQVARQLELCLQPETQRLLQPALRSWRQRLRSAPLTSMVLAGVLPNALGSALNIPYNLDALVDSLADERAREVFYQQLLVVNPIAYSVGAAILLWIAWPVLCAVMRLGDNTPSNSMPAPALRDRCLKLGDFVAWVSAFLWVISGFVFPTWLHFEMTTTGLNHTAKEINSDFYIHWFASQFLCGLLAATLAFFLVTTLCVSAFYPVLLSGEGDDPDAGRGLRSLARRLTTYLRIGFGVVILSFVAFLFIGGNSKAVFATIGIVGVLTSYSSFQLLTHIRSDLEALAPAVHPSGDLLGRSTDSTSESFWTASR